MCGFCNYMAMMSIATHALLKLHERILVIIHVYVTVFVINKLIVW